MTVSQYFRIVNLDRREWFDPDDFGETEKHPDRDPKTLEALGRLLMPGGRWCGDRIAIVGDESAAQIGHTASTYLYHELEDDGEPPKWTNIADQIGGTPWSRDDE